MNDLLPFLIAFAPFFVAFMFAINNKRCPDCETQLPLLISPLTKTRRQWLEGGWICPKCGIDVDSNGQKVEMPHVVRWGKTLAVLPFLIASFGVAIVLIYWALQTEPVKPAPPQQPLKMAVALPSPSASPQLPSHS